MKKNYIPFKNTYILLAILISSLCIGQTTYYSRASGIWNDTNTWSLANGCVTA
ncbi:hypothetical protein [Flavobacterium weaverense]|uniref:Uncharacterized protein n=1 Tax=Flavobacterium weaverense TaxID=271156 RepID=A0A3M0ACK1_9FLAO|nr:hypothetical protein [Flavobacterium weaverense]RMA76882.1 hypothetical protein BC961_0860 [Flavobacterium weaverense]